MKPAEEIKELAYRVLVYLSDELGRAGTYVYMMLLNETEKLAGTGTYSAMYCEKICTAYAYTPMMSSSGLNPLYIMTRDRSIVYGFLEDLNIQHILLLETRDIPGYMSRRYELVQKRFMEKTRLLGYDDLSFGVLNTGFVAVVEKGYKIMVSGDKIVYVEGDSYLDMTDVTMVQNMLGAGVESVKKYRVVKNVLRSIMRVREHLPDLARLLVDAEKVLFSGAYGFLRKRSR